MLADEVDCLAEVGGVLVWVVDYLGLRRGFGLVVGAYIVADAVQVADYDFEVVLLGLLGDRGKVR